MSTTARIALAAALLLALLAGCGAVPTPAPAERPTEVIAGGVAADLGPEAVAANFFEDLGSALRDPTIDDVETRKRWVDRLAGYFAPNERDDQRAALRAAIYGMVRAQQQRTSKTKLTLDLRVERVERVDKSPAGATHALVRPVNAQLVLVYQTERGPEDGEKVDIAKLIGRSELPVVRIGDRWFLSANDDQEAQP